MKKFSVFSLALALALTTFSAKAEDQVTNLTIYGNSPQTWNMPFYYGAGANIPGSAVISFARQVSFSAGVNEVVAGNIPDEIDPSTIMIKALGRGLQVVEQNYSSSKLSAGDLIKRNIGKEIEVEKYSNGSAITVKGTLLDASSGLIIKDGDNLKIVNDYSALTFANENNSAAGNSIKWLIKSANSVDSIFEYSYKTQGISWSANYNVYLDGNSEDVMAKIEGWANLMNNTNTSIKETNIKLVAGEVAMDDNGGGGRPVPMMAMAKVADASESGIATSMQEQKFSDYHMYTIDRKVALPATSSKKIKLFDDKEGVLATKKYVYEGANGDNSVKAVITFVNDEKSRLGIPMPGGKYRIFSKDTSGQFEQIGEATAEHKSEGEKLELTTGNSFDLKAERQQVDSEQDQLRHRGKYTVTVEIQSALEDKVDVIVREPMYQQNWEIVTANFDYKKTNANQVEFTVPTKPKDKVKLEYVVQYSW